MRIEPIEWVALAALTLLCLALRWVGFLAASAADMPPRAKRLLHCVPAPLLAALVASSAAQEGVGAVIAVVVAVAVMAWIGNELIAAAVAAAAAFLLL